jgi:hypothetical protein
MLLVTSVMTIEEEEPRREDERRGVPVLLLASVDPYAAPALGTVAFIASSLSAVDRARSMRREYTPSASSVLTSGGGGGDGD